MANLTETLAQIAKPLTLARNEYLLQPGQVEHHLYLVKSGAIRAFIISEFEEHTIRFGYTGSTISALDSYFTGKPTQMYLQAIRKTEILKVPKSQLNDLLQGHPENQQEYIQTLGNLAIQQMEREMDLLTYSPTERLKRVQQRSPKLFQEIPMKYIASYLRMTPETLSRILNS